MLLRRIADARVFNCEDDRGRLGVNGSKWGWNEFLKWDKFEDHPDLLPDGSFTLKCRVTVFGTERILSGSDNDSESSDVLLKTWSQNQLSEQLRNLFINKQLCSRPT